MTSPTRNEVAAAAAPLLGALINTLGRRFDTVRVSAIVGVLVDYLTLFREQCKKMEEGRVQ